MFKLFRQLALTSLVISSLTTAAFAQWTPLNNPCPVRAGQTLLLTDGTVFVHDPNATDWWKLTPDNTGSYVNGSWTQAGTMVRSYSPLYDASAVLPDGKVIVEGGEYNGSNTEVWTNLGEIYDPLTDLWSIVNPPTGWTNIGDAQSCVLPDGTFMMANLNDNTAVAFDESTLTWSAIGTGKADRQDEEGWTLLPDGTILTVDGPNQPAAEKFDIGSATWISAGTVTANLFDTATLETGPQILRPDGTVFCMGGTQFTAIYTPPANHTDPGTWTTGPNFPIVGGKQLDIADGPACLLPNGDVLAIASPGVFNVGAQVLDFNGTSFTVLGQFPNATTDASYSCSLIMLPNGQVMLTDQSSDVEIFTPQGTSNAWRPTISSCQSNLRPGSSYPISGTQFNGLSQCSGYGDDEQNATNYPIVRITNLATKHVFYCRTFNHSTMAVATGNATVSTNFTVPGRAENGTSKIEVVANGIASVPFAITVGQTVTSYTVSSHTIAGSYGVFGVVHLVVNAQQGGQPVALTGGDSHVSYPGTVTVLEGNSSIQFLINTTSVSSNDVETLTATIGTSSKTITLTVVPSPVKSLTFSPSSVMGGNTAIGTVTLYLSAGPSGDLVSLAGGDSNVTYPPSVKVPVGLTSKTFTITTGTVNSNTPETLTASLGTTSKSATLMITPTIGLSSFTITVTPVKGGNSSGGIVHLTNPAGAMGQIVTITGGDAFISYSSSFKIPAGGSGASFLITTKPVLTNTNEVLTAHVNGSVMTKTLVLTP